MESISLKCPAKINLHLRVTGKRKDGYHELVTLFHRISLSDSMSVRKIQSGFKLTCNQADVPTDESNLVTKAYRLLQEHYPRLGGVSVSLNKKIPAGGGLGGGSSDAASFLMGAKKLFRLKISNQDLLEESVKLGADVPFFMMNAVQALGTGVGEKLEVIPCQKKLWFLVLTSPKSLKTADVFKKFKIPSNPPSLTTEKGVVRILARFFNEGKSEDATGLIQNDLEESALQIQPEIKKMMSELNRMGAESVHLTGSGPTVYCVSSRQQVIRKLANSLQRENIFKNRYFVCSSQL